MAHRFGCMASVCSAYLSVSAQLFCTKGASSRTQVSSLEKPEAWGRKLPYIWPVELDTDARV